MKVFSPFLNGTTTTSGSFNVPNHPTTASIQNPLTGSLFHDDTDGILKIYTGTQWQVVGEQAIPVVGPASADIEYLLVAGGAAGGGSQSWGAGGGGAGGYLSSSLASVTSGSSFTITVGAGGGAVTNAVGTSGTNSSIAGATISTIIAAGGGGGGGQLGSKTDGADGGSGGGAQGAAIYATEGSGTAGQGNDGGPGADGQSVYTAGGGGGGATTVGQDASIYADKSGGNGGTGATSTITGTSVERAGGGGGGTNNGSGGSGTGGTATGGGGAGGTGYAGNNGADGTSATANTGGGGGGAGHGTGAAGGSGVAIFAYPTASISATGGVRTFFNDRVAHTFNSSGTFAVGGIKTYTHNTLDIFGDSSCIALYNLDGNANDTGGSYNGTASNVTYAQSYINQGGDFNGSSSYISRDNAFLPTGNASRSFSFWTKLDTHSADAYFMSYGNGVTGQFFSPRVTPTAQGGYISFMGYAADLNSNVVMTTGEWMHLCYTYDGTTLKIYKNATEIGSGNISLNTATTRDFIIGARDYNGSITKHIDGKLDQIRIFNKALTASEVTTLYAE